MAFKADAVKIRRWREERQWSQEHLADLAGLGLRTVQRIENGEPASKDTLMALAAAFNVDASTLAVDPETEARDILREKNAAIRSGIRLSLWIHLAGYAVGIAVFTGISLGISSEYFAMKWPLIWWTTAVVAHAATAVIIHVATGHADR
ncbi:helix-turn-helix transcriptional regulator [Hyphobacterium sp. HN65]|uniref:Helix-turn-helix transcriptional regulator n=1 Tax=Hyphobacterium lacteum TaxID=3116575 RepID=A0ABU7LRH1_9PROT|nr:helix-turn-helix transcriptional regulator [Hyphobacterium sp. HN65]MEE2526511.1 helix-turn-helix transcriptional regulator [Hyphobacterium sp. HN65]